MARARPRPLIARASACPRAGGGGGPALLPPPACPPDRLSFLCFFVCVCVSVLGLFRLGLAMTRANGREKPSSTGFNRRPRTSLFFSRISRSIGGRGEEEEERSEAAARRRRLVARRPPPCAP